eukprot:5610580-Alexandrium_andersonii.AAC.1
MGIIWQALDELLGRRNARQAAKLAWRVEIDRELAEAVDNWWQRLRTTRGASSGTAATEAHRRG